MENEPLHLKTKKFIEKKVREVILDSAIAILLLSFVFGFIGGASALYIGPRYLGDILGDIFSGTIIERTLIERESIVYEPQTSEESKRIDVISKSSPSVVSVIATKDLPIIEQFFVSPFDDDIFGGLFPGFRVPQYRENGTETRQVSAGTGFVAGTDLIITNKHVVADTAADYTIITHSGQKFEAEVIARDPIEDLAILRVLNLGLAPLKLGDSDSLATGQTVITIGNALGEFQNSVSIGVVSGLSRTLTASGVGVDSEILREVIQTDAAINPGNSGGPLINLSGGVIGVNVARAQGADNIGFSVPINRIKNSLEQAVTTGKVSYPFLGVRYIIITPDFKVENDLSVDYGALIIRGDELGQIAVVPGSAADRAGIVENDIILEISGERVTASNLLADIISGYKVGDTISLKVYHRGEESIVNVVLGERP